MSYVLAVNNMRCSENYGPLLAMNYDVAPNT